PRVGVPPGLARREHEVAEPGGRREVGIGRGEIDVDDLLPHAQARRGASPPFRTSPEDRVAPAKPALDRGRGPRRPPPKPTPAGIDCAGKAGARKRGELARGESASPAADSFAAKPVLERDEVGGLSSRDS